VPDELVEILTSYLANKEPDELLFPSYRHDGALSLSVFEDRWNKACNARWRLYDLRHLNASILIYSGLNIIEVAQRLGHSVQVCSSVYLHALESLNASPTTKLNEFLNRN
jgi:integrase